MRSVWLAIILCPGLAIPAYATTIFTQDYEVATITNLPNHPTGERAHLVTSTIRLATVAIVADPLGIHGQVLRLTYNDGIGCYSPCGDGNDASATFWFNPQPEIYGRYYYMTGPVPPATSSSYSSVVTKQHYFRANSADNYPDGVTVNMWGSPSMSIGVQSPTVPGGAKTFNPNGANKPLSDNVARYCIEYHWKMSTPNVADGVFELSVDGARNHQLCEHTHA